MAGDLPSPIRTLQDVVDVIHAIEATYPVDRWQVGALDVWPIARIQMGFRLFRAIEGADARAAESGLRLALRRLRSAPHAISAGLGRRYSSPGSTPAVFLADGRSFVTTPDGLLDRQCDPLRRAFHAEGVRSLLLLPEQAGPMWCEPTASEQAGLDLAVLRARVRRTADADLPGYGDVAEELRRAGQAAALLERHALLRRAGDVAAMASHFEKVLARAEARIALLSEFYSARGMAFVLAARRTGVASVDIQHGVEGPLHFAYSDWTRLPDGGSALLPDRFWVWSALEQRCIAGWAPEGCRAIVGGNAYLEASRRGELPGSATAIRGVDALLQRSGAERLVLVALSGEEPDRFVAEVLAASRESRGWLWAIRSHPTAPDGPRWSRAAAAEGITSIETEESSSLPLPALLARSTAVLTRFSTVTLEAASVGVPTVLIDPLGAELFAQQVRSGAAVVADLDAVAILQALHSAESGATPSTTGESVRSAVRELITLAHEH